MGSLLSLLSPLSSLLSSSSSSSSSSLPLPPLPSSPPLTLHPFRPLPAALLPNLSLPCLPTPVLLLFPSSFSSPICFFSFAWLHHHNFQGNVLKGFLSCNTRSYPLVSDGSSDA